MSSSHMPSGASVEDVRKDSGSDPMTMQTGIGSPFDGRAQHPRTVLVLALDCQISALYAEILSFEIKLVHFGIEQHLETQPDFFCCKLPLWQTVYAYMVIPSVNGKIYPGEGFTLFLNREYVPDSEIFIIMLQTYSQVAWIILLPPIDEVGSALLPGSGPVYRTHGKIRCEV